jgi:hypothetical protein
MELYALTMMIVSLTSVSTASALQMTVPMELCALTMMTAYQVNVEEKALVYLTLSQI